MSTFEWDEKFNVGHRQIDSDHKHLFELCNEFTSAIKEGHKHAAVKETLEELFSYTGEHFDREETYMRENGYEEYEDHKKSTKL